MINFLPQRYAREPDVRHLSHSRAPISLPRGSRLRYRLFVSSARGGGLENFVMGSEEV